MMKCVLGMFLLCICSVSLAKHVELLNTELHYIKSKANAVEYKIYVELPSNYQQNKNKEYPVVYLLDAYWHFPINYNEDFIIVGIGYKDYDAFTANKENDLGLKRLRDLLPFTIKAEDLKKVDTIKKYYNSNIIGNAKSFKSFLQNELMPFINKQYRTSEEKVLLGHSLGGLFASWILLNDSDLFQNYIILSPALLYGNYSIFDNIKNIEKISNKKMVYIAVGEKESEELFRSFVSDVEDFYQKVKDKPNLTSKMDIIKDGHHIDMLPYAITNGLKFVLNYTEKQLA